MINNSTLLQTADLKIWVVFFLTYWQKANVGGMHCDVKCVLASVSKSLCSLRYNGFKEKQTLYKLYLYNNILIYLFKIKFQYIILSEFLNLI